MRILALETSMQDIGVALLDDEQVIATAALPRGQRTARHLTPLLQDTIRRAAWPLATLELIAVNRGPGSFTGLRVGVTTAKVLAYALGMDVVVVDSLEVIASQTHAFHSWVTTVLDAQRRQFFSAEFYFGAGGELQQRTDTQLVEIDAWLRSLRPEGLVTGPGLALPLPALPDSTRVAPRDCWIPRAETVGRLGRRLWEAGRKADMWTLSPSYHRRSAAEEKFDSTG